MLLSHFLFRFPQRWLWLIVADILTATLHFDPTLLRGYLVGRIKAAEDDDNAPLVAASSPSGSAAAAVSSQSSGGYGNGGGGVVGQGIMHSLMRVVTTRDPDIDTGLIQQCAELMRLLLDAESMRVVERETFLRHVFETHLRPLVAVLQVRKNNSGVCACVSVSVYACVGTLYFDVCCRLFVVFRSLQRVF